MYVKTFASETLDDALKQIKKELGPEAIILKTITNKGLKGAFKKSRIEITAGITEKQYEKKAHVDSVLSKDQKSQFYQEKAKDISQMIDSFDEHRTPKKQDYGKLGLNKAVKNKIRDELDDFLSKKNKEKKTIAAPSSNEDTYDESERLSSTSRNLEKLERRDQSEDNFKVDSSQLNELILKVNRIEDLEKKIDELTQSLSQIEGKGPQGLFQLRSFLRSVNIDQVFIQKIIKKALFEYNEEELNNIDILFDLSLREMANHILTDLPLFSSVHVNGRPVVTIFVSEVSCGQTSMMYKLGNLKKDSAFIVYGDEKNLEIKDKMEMNSFIPKIFNMEIQRAKNLPETINQCRKFQEGGKSVFIDYRYFHSNMDDTKNFLDGIKKSFPHVEVLLCLSAIHSEEFNRKMAYKYKDVVNGMIFSYLDLCLNFSSIFNIHLFQPEIPLKFFGTGDVIPEDLEAASSERILSKIFGFN